MLVVSTSLFAAASSLNIGAAPFFFLSFLPPLSLSRRAEEENGTVGHRQSGKGYTRFKALSFPLFLSEGFFFLKKKKSQRVKEATSRRKWTKKREGEVLTQTRGMNSTDHVGPDVVQHQRDPVHSVRPMSLCFLGSLFHRLANISMRRLPCLLGSHDSSWTTPPSGRKATKDRCNHPSAPPDRFRAVCTAPRYTVQHTHLDTVLFLCLFFQHSQLWRCQGQCSDCARQHLL